MRILLGATKYEYSSTSGARVLTIRKNAQKKFTNNTESSATEGMPTGDGKTVAGKNHFPEAKPDTYKWINMTTGARGQAKKGSGSTYTGEPSVAAGETNIIRYFWEEEVESADVGATELVISPDTFPSTYRMVGDALIRSEATNSDEAFQFVVHKAKLLSEVTLTMQAEGDPSVNLVC